MKLAQEKTQEFAGQPISFHDITGSPPLLHPHGPLGPGWRQGSWFWGGRGVAAGDSVQFTARKDFTPVQLAWRAGELTFTVPTAWAPTPPVSSTGSTLPHARAAKAGQGGTEHWSHARAHFGEGFWRVPDVPEACRWWGQLGMLPKAIRASSTRSTAPTKPKLPPRRGFFLTVLARCCHDAEVTAAAFPAELSDQFCQHSSAGGKAIFCNSVNRYTSYPRFHNSS